MSTAVYMRVSTEAQADRGTIEAQREYAEKYVDLLGIADKVQYFAEDGFTGTIPLSDRPVGRQMVDDINAGRIKEVLVYKIDRFGRDTRTILNSVYELEQAGAIIKSMTEPFDTSTPAGRFVLSIMAASAALDRDTIIDRLTTGVYRSARRDGRWMGGIVPLGYHVENHYLVIDEEESKTVRLIYDLALQRYSTVRIAEQLNALKVPTVYATKGYKLKTGTSTGLWFPGRIYNILTAEIYKGIHTYGKKSKNGKEPIVRRVPAIIDEEKWDAVQDILRLNQIDSIGDSKNFYLLRGLLQCGNCGLSLCGGHKREKRFYRCIGRSKLVGHDTRCLMPSLDAELAEEYVWNQILQFADNPDEMDSYFDIGNETKNSRSLSDERESVRTAIKDREREYGALLDMILRKAVNQEIGEIKLSKINADIDLLKDRLRIIDSEKINTDQLISHFSAAKARIRDVVGNVDENDPETKRVAIRRVVDKIVVSLVPDPDDPTAPKKMQLKIKYNFLRSEVTRTIRHAKILRQFCPVRSFA